MSGDNQAFPFTKAETSDAEMFIQWKGTDACFDFWCQCGHQGHFDGYFAYAVQCPGCGVIYDLGTQVIIRRRPENPEYFLHEPKILDTDDEATT